MKYLKRYITFLALLFLITVADAQWTKVILRTDVIVTDNITDATFVNSDTGFLTTNSGVLYKTVDGGYNWTFDTVNIGGGIDRIFFASDKIGYMTVAGGNYPAYGTVIKTNDGGNTWLDVGQGNHMGFGLGLYFLNVDTGFVGCAAGLYFKTYNGGQTWNWTFLDAVQITDIRFLNDTLGFMFQRCPSSEGSLTITRDGGNTWIPRCGVFPKLFDDWKYAYLLNDSIYIGFNTNVRLTKGNVDGSNFQYIFPRDSIYTDPQFQTSDLSRDICFYNEQLGMVAYRNAVTITENSGDTWIITNFQDTASFYSSSCGVASLHNIASITSNKWIVYGECGRVYITENRGGITTGIRENESEPLFSVYPNPVQSKLLVSIHPILNQTSLKIITIEGKKVMQNIPAIQTKTEIDVSSLPAGLYFLVLQNEKERIVKRFVKQ